MAKKAKFPEDSTGHVEGVDGPVPRTRANVLKGFTEPIERHWYDRTVGQDGINLTDRVTDEFLG